MLWDPALFRQAARVSKCLSVHHELPTLSKKTSSFRCCILAVTCPKEQRVREPNEGVGTFKTCSLMFTSDWNYVTKPHSEKRPRGQFAFSSPCLFCRELLREHGLCRLYSSSDRGAPKVCSFAYSCFHKEWVLLTNSQGNCARAMHRHVRVHTNTHTHRDHFPASADC